jgi:hypothetical protein
MCNCGLTLIIDYPIIILRMYHHGLTIMVDQSIIILLHTITKTWDKPQVGPVA